MEFENIGKGTQAFLRVLDEASDASRHDDENPMDDADKACARGVFTVIRDWIIPTADDQQEIDDRVVELLNNIYTKGKDFEKPICLAIQRMYNMSRFLDNLDGIF